VSDFRTGALPTVKLPATLQNGVSRLIPSRRNGAWRLAFGPGGDPGFNGDGRLAVTMRTDNERLEDIAEAIDRILERTVVGKEALNRT
jgi:hypothetical protein